MIKPLENNYYPFYKTILEPTKQFTYKRLYFVNFDWYNIEISNKILKLRQKIFLNLKKI